MRTIRRIVLHHSASSSTWTVLDIDRIHRERGFDGLGYHRVVYPDGYVHPGRALNVVGAHAKGANEDSIGICLVGSFELRPGETSAPMPTPEQWDAALDLVEELLAAHSLTPEDVYGHREVGTTATVCPGFDPEAFRVVLRQRYESAG